MPDIEKKVLDMKARREEVYESIVARKGEKGMEYVRHVQDAARAISVIQAFNLTMGKSVGMTEGYITKQLHHAVSSILVVGTERALILFNIPQIVSPEVDQFTKEFMSDVQSVTRYMILPVKVGEQEDE